MMKLNRLYFYILLSFLHCSFALDKEPLEDFDLSKAMVSFNPYVSVLDRYNKSRYGPADLIPLIEKVATRFSKIHIELSTSTNYRPQNSLEETPFAVAQYNCLATTKKKIEVFLELRDINNFGYIISVADNANTACNGTVVSIILGADVTLRPGYIDQNKKFVFDPYLNNQFNYSFGLSFSEQSYCEYVSNVEQINVDVLLLIYQRNKEFLPQYFNCEPFHVTRKMSKHLKLSTSAYLRYRRTDLNINTTRLITNWRHLSNLLSDMYLISFAFDYYSEHNEYSPDGWWYLVKDSVNANTSEYIFEEKISVASKFEFEEHPKNFKWLEQHHKFDENTIGIVSVRKSFNDLDELKYFCRVMNLNEMRDIYEYTNTTYIYFFRTLKKPWFLKSCKNFSVYHMPIFMEKKNVSLNTLEKRLAHFFTSGHNNISVHTINGFGPKKGYAYPINFCGEYRNTSENSAKFCNKISQANVEIIIFYFSEDEYSVRLGATTLVRQRIALFENCINLVYSVRNTSFEIDFVSLGYFRVDTFSLSPLALQNYVKYTYLLENWAKNQTNTVVFIGQFQDEEIKLKGVSAESSNVVGWMSYYSSTNTYISKRVEALKISKLNYPELKELDPVLTKNQVFLVVGISLAVCLIIIAIVTFIVRHYYKNGSITNVEINMFLNGDDQSDTDAHKIPYDKEKYEISEKNFKLESEVPLGAGEFGAVFRGIIDQTSGNLQVAVKTSNPQKIHKTQLTGLLSEIKVLAYIGKHANITELLGANTSSLKNGKVYIFLEFCHLGSLQKYLYEMRSLVSSPIQETNVDTATHGNVYSNSTASKQTTIDDSLSKDLYRWSTEICNGMGFLAEKHVVHADLATRNVLLNLRRQAKICDFGLSRRMYNYTNYVKTQQEPLPWKWMAPESLRDMIFNEKTDVWAYGVTLWEMYSLASNPYAGLSWDANFSQMLERGLRLSEPEYCETEMYEKMQKCWNIFPDNRPSFSEMLLILQSSNDEQASV